MTSARVQEDESEDRRRAQGRKKKEAQNRRGQAKQCVEGLGTRRSEFRKGGGKRVQFNQTFLLLSCDFAPKKDNPAEKRGPKHEGGGCKAGSPLKKDEARGDRKKEGLSVRAQKGREE